MEESGEFATVWRRHECEPPEAPSDLIDQAKARVSDTVVAQWFCPTCRSLWEFANWYTVGSTSCWWRRATVRLMRPPRSPRRRWWRRTTAQLGKKQYAPGVGSKAIKASLDFETTFQAAEEALDRAKEANK